jgi:acyl-CoA synthetase (AMP-forming)/AMP-acid ligase II
VKALFVLKDYAERMRPMAKAVPQIQFIFNVDGTPVEGEINFEQTIPPVDVPQFAEPEGVQPEDEALIVYTSGTTGVPKGVALAQYALIADAFAITQWHGIRPDTKMMCVLPVHHVNGLEVTHVTPMFAGASVVLTRKFSATQFFKTINQYSVEIVSVVPTLLQFLLEAHPQGAAAPSLRHIICGAGPLTVDLAARFEDRFNIPICHGYGLSETTCYSCFVPAPARGCDRAQYDKEHRPWIRDHGYPSIGVAVGTNLMAIHDDSGNEVAEGAKGEIVIRGHNVMLGYHENLKANEGAFTHGWFRSGDEGFFLYGAHREKYFFISGRFKELIIRGGVKISPLEVDEVLNRIPGVKAAMAVGFDNVTYGEEVGAYVVKLPGAELTEEMVIKAARATLPFALAPKVVVFGETFPVTSTGKYQRNQLKPQFAQWKEKQFREK